jgi:hypothetical protein
MTDLDGGEGDPTAIEFTEPRTGWEREPGQSLQ